MKLRNIKINRPVKEICTLNKQTLSIEKRINNDAGRGTQQETNVQRKQQY
jgi:hypothetical protein